MLVFERYKGIIDDWPAFVDACSAPLPACVWANPERISPAHLADRFKKAGVAFEAIPWYPGAFRITHDQGLGNRFEYLAGLYAVQEEVAMLPAFLLSPRPGERVLDLCAAPGNKTAQMAFMMQNRGILIANDVSNERMRALRQTVNRLGLRNVAGTLRNAASFPRQPFLFDKVIADVHCSCEGTSRKNPEVLHHARRNNLGGAQKAILQKALQLCRVGGFVLYSTCTYAPEENEMVVESALNDLAPKIEGVIRPLRIPLRHSSGLHRWQTHRFRSDMQNTIRIYPHQNDTGGFFIALVEKVSESGAGYLASGSTAPERKYKSVDEVALLTYVESRFGIPAGSFEDGRFFQVNGKTIALTSIPDSLIPVPFPRIIGLPFARARMRYPKITTAACLAFGRLATRHVVELDRSQTENFLRGRSVSAGFEQTRALSHHGFVVVRHQGFCIGSADVELLEREIKVMSLFPKAWRRDALLKD